MKIKFFSICALFFITSSSYCQISKTEKSRSDALVSLWNTGFNSDEPKNIEMILTDNVVMMSGEQYLSGKDSVMNQFVVMRMPMISDLNAVNEFYSVAEGMIYTAGSYSLKVNRKDGSIASSIGNFTFIWKKQKDNSYKIDFIHLESIPKN